MYRIAAGLDTASAGSSVRAATSAVILGFGAAIAALNHTPLATTLRCCGSIRGCSVVHVYVLGGLNALACAAVGLPTQAHRRSHAECGRSGRRQVHFQLGVFYCAHKSRAGECEAAMSMLQQQRLSQQSRHRCGRRAPRRAAVQRAGFRLLAAALQVHKHHFAPLHRQERHDSCSGRTCRRQWSAC
jgi:hypothetical protein